MTLVNTGNTHECHEFQFHDFSPSNKFNNFNLKLQFLPYSGRFIYLTFANTNKHEQNDEIRHSSFKSSKHRQCIPATKPAYLQKVDSRWDKPCEFF